MLFQILKTQKMKKISLLFACIAIVSFTTNAQEPVKVKSKKDPVKVAPVERATKAEKVTIAEPPLHTDIQPTTKPVEKVENVNVGDTKTTAPTVKRSTNVKKHPVKPANAKATAVPVIKAGEAK